MIHRPRAAQPRCLRLALKREIGFRTRNPTRVAFLLVSWPSCDRERRAWPRSPVQAPRCLAAAGCFQPRRRSYDFRMTTPAPNAAAGSVGTVDTQFVDLPRPLALDCGRDLHPVRVAYETYGTLSPARDNVILVCHALSGDAHAAGYSRVSEGGSTRDGFRAEERDGGSGRGLGWWDGMIGPGKAFDTDRFFVVSTNLLGGCRGTTGPWSTDPATGRPYGAGLSGDHGGRHGAHPAGGAHRARHRPARGRGGRLARRHAGVRVGDPVPRPGRRDHSHRQHSCAAATGRGLERDRPQRDHGGSGLAARAVLRHRPRAGRGHGRGPDGGTRHLSFRAVPRRQVRPAAAVCRRPPLHHHRTGVRGRELPPASGRDVREALRRQHLSLYVAGAVLFRSGAPVRRRPAR